MASLAGAWMALVYGFGGLRDTDGELSFDPQLPSAISRLRFTIRWQGLRLGVDVTHDEATYTLRDGPDASLTLRHDGAAMTVDTSAPMSRPVKKRTATLPRPEQPPGREPMSRSR
jgi:trehalose/maltose hydrolase-like predicted phosphorylase